MQQINPQSNAGATKNSEYLSFLPRTRKDKNKANRNICVTDTDTADIIKLWEWCQIGVLDISNPIRSLSSYQSVANSVGFIYFFKHPSLEAPDLVHLSKSELSYLESKVKRVGQIVERSNDTLMNLWR